jgi:hypothetical protein
MGITALHPSYRLAGKASSAWTNGNIIFVNCFSTVDGYM